MLFGKVLMLLAGYPVVDPTHLIHVYSYPGPVKTMAKSEETLWSGLVQLFGRNDSHDLCTMNHSSDYILPFNSLPQ